MMDWDDIRLVAEISKHGGLSQAARVLKVSHSTLLRRVQVLEKHMGVRLFDRLPSGYVPTEAGREIALAGGRIEGEVFSLQTSLAGRDQDPEGTLKITAPSLLIGLYLSPILRDFKKAYPRIDLILNSANEELNLHQREADVAIRATNSPSESLFGRKLVSQRRYVYAAQEYFDDHPHLTPQSAMDAGFDWLGFEAWSAEMISSLPGAKLAARFDDMPALLGCLQVGMGIARLPSCLGDTNDKLVRLTAFPAEPYFDFWILTHPSLKDVARVRLFMKFVSARFETDRAFFLGENSAT